MNLVFAVGRFGKVWHEAEKSYIFKVSVRRDYKNKETGKYDWDNITFNCPAYNKATVKFLENYVNEGDIVSVQGHVNTYAVEKDGEKVYHEDKVCDSLRIVSRKSDGEGSNVVSEEPIKADAMDGFTEVDIDDEEVPF